MTYNVHDSIKAQKEKGNKFVPKSGVCWRCKENIYKPVRKKILQPDMTFKDHVTGYTVEEARTKFISGCPHCNRSFVS